MSLAGFRVGHTVKLVKPHPQHYRNGRRFPSIGETGIVTEIITNSQYTYTRVLLVLFSQCGEEWEKLPAEVEHEQEEQQEREDMWLEGEFSFPEDWRDLV